MTSTEQATFAAMEKSGQAHVRLFAIVYSASNPAVRATMRRDPVWIEYAVDEVLPPTADEKKELAELRRWKTEQMQVESQWNPQAVGRAMGLGMGIYIRPAILPYIENRQMDIERLKATKAELLDALIELRNWYYEQTGIPAAKANRVIENASK
jgi:ribosomal protein L29